MSGEIQQSLVSIDDFEDWSEGELDDDSSNTAKSLGGRQRVEKKLEDLQLWRETSEYNFHI